MRFGDAASLSLGGGSIYYGTADATPLFVMLLGEMRRWGVARELVDELLPNAARAIEWIEHFGDADGDGYVEYRRATDRGLANQGWKDSWDGIRYGDGRVAEAPIALAEVQAYTYGAYLASAHFAFEAGDTATYDRFRAKASHLKADFNRDFWLEDKGWFAVGLDADKRPIDSLTSNIGHCLWTGIIDEDKAQQVAQALVGPSMFSGWGLRTLSSDNGGYNPISYHCGSVWPHDTAIVAAGLARYGFDGAAQQLIFGLLDAAAAQGGRLPELFSGLDRGELTVPGRLPDVVLAPGLGGGIAAAVPAHPAPARPVDPLRQDVAVPEPARRHRLPEGRGDPPGRVAGHHRGGRRRARRGVGHRPAAGDRGHPRARGDPRPPSDRTGPAGTGGGRSRRSPAPLDPLGEVGRLGADRGAGPVAGQDQGVGSERREQPVLDGADDGGEVGVLERGVARPSREEGVPGEQQRRALDGEAHRARGVPGRGDGGDRAGARPRGPPRRPGSGRRRGACRRRPAVTATS